MLQGEKKIWISWEKHRRTRELSCSLPGVGLFELEFEGYRLIRYPYLLSRTFFLLLKERPSLTLIQSPSVILALFMVTVGKLLTAKVVVDAHNEGLRPYYSKYNWMMPLYRIIQKKADITIVTNEMLKVEVVKNGGRPFVLEDKIPQFDPVFRKMKGRYNIAYICTFEKDEPYSEVIRSAELLDPYDYIYITGRYEQISSEIIENAPSNVIFTGYLPENKFVNLLFSCDVIMDLTHMDDCLVCGAYEGVGLGKPLILSDSPVSRKYFSKGAVYTKNNPESIAESINKFLKNREQLQQDIICLREELQSSWEKKLIRLIQLIDYEANSKSQ